MTTEEKDLLVMAVLATGLAVIAGPSPRRLILLLMFTVWILSIRVSRFYFGM